MSYATSGVERSRQSYYDQIDNGKRIVDTRKQTSNTYTTDQLQAMLANNQIDTSKITNVDVQTVSANSSECTDGKDDGKVGFFEGLFSVVKGAVKGVVNGIKGMFTDENGNFSLFNTLKSVAMVGACFIPGVGPFISAGLCAYGLAKGAMGVAQGISAAANARTDAEAKAALESCGANGAVAVASAVGLKGSMGAIAAQSGIEGGIINSIRTEGLGSTLGKMKTGVTNYYQGAWDAAGGGLSGVKAVGKEAIKGTYKNMYNAYTTVKNKVNTKLGKQGTVEADTFIQKHQNWEGIEDVGTSQSGTITKGNKTIEYTTNAEGKIEFTTVKGNAPKSTTMTSEVEFDSLSKSTQKQLNETGEWTDPKNGKTYTKNAETGKVDVATPAKTRTTTMSLDNFKKMFGEDAIGQLSADKTVKLPGGGKATFEINGNTVTLTSTKPMSGTGYKLNNLKQTALKEGYTGLPSSGNVKRAGIATASATSASKDYITPILNASQSYATVDTQKGHYYELENYSFDYNF